MPLLSYALTTVADFKLYHGITVSSYDALLEALINRCTVFIENYLGGRRIKNSGSNITELYNGSLGIFKRSIFLKSFPVTSIVSVELDTGVNFSIPEYDLLDATTDYICWKEAGELQILRYLPKQINAVRVVYQGGYTTIPEDLILACNMLVGKTFDKRRSQGVDREEISDAVLQWGNNEVSAPFSLTPEIKAILDGYKSFVFS